MNEDFTRIPLGQASFLLKLTDSKNNMAYAEGKSEGASAKELHRKGYCIPFGSAGRRVRWKLVKALSKEQIALLHNLSKV